ncbi:hypothetical protein TGRUB_275710 [Toxoplasma gondii RUB]|uniref:Uncharacterized protein n=1 Tax=Toxoplasma gondii RUB TaxID=935652 RepID=A0A086LMU6_TOXGO|nr:hypothetical protein TGRUB_275710 [Toxoplasma gondii RUB]
MPNTGSLVAAALGCKSVLDSQQQLLIRCSAILCLVSYVTEKEELVLNTHGDKSPGMLFLVINERETTRTATRLVTVSVRHGRTASRSRNTEPILERKPLVSDTDFPTATLLLRCLQRQRASSRVSCLPVYIMEKHMYCLVFFSLALFPGQQLQNGAWAQRSFRHRGASVSSSSFITSSSSHTPFRGSAVISSTTPYTTFGSSSGISSYSPVSADSTFFYPSGPSTYEPHTFRSPSSSSYSSFGSFSIPVSDSEVGSHQTLSSTHGSTYFPSSFTGSSIAASDSYAVGGSGRRGRNRSSFVLSNDIPSASIVSSTDAFVPASGSSSVVNSDFQFSYTPHRSGSSRGTAIPVIAPGTISGSSPFTVFHEADDNGDFVSTYAPRPFNSEMGAFESLTDSGVRSTPTGETTARGRGSMSRRREGSTTATHTAAPASPNSGFSNGSARTTTSTTTAPTVSTDSQSSATNDSAGFEVSREMPGDVIVEERDGQFIYFFVEEDGRRTQLENAPPLEEMEPDSFFTEQYLLDKPIKLLDHEQQEKAYKARMEKPTNTTRISLTSPTGETHTITTEEERQDGLGLMALPPRQRELGLL